MNTKELTACALMLALLIICSQLMIPIEPVPITLQTLAVTLIGMLLPVKLAVITTLSYMILGLIGLPVFSNFSGGFHSVLKPSFGFIISFVVAVAIQAYYLSKCKKIGYREWFISAIINAVITYLIGIPYMAMILNGYTGLDMDFQAILMTGLIPFIPGTILKILASVWIAEKIYPKIPINSK